MALKQVLSRQGLQQALGLNDAEQFRKAYLLPALASGLVEMTLPDKPQSSKQGYPDRTAPGPVAPAGREAGRVAWRGGGRASKA